ncbi:MAG: hypothetical protein M1371_07320 [Actinobacteria bacterium]|nr:hypothetical protein [Actinomycetota bacterium]
MDQETLIRLIVEEVIRQLNVLRKPSRKEKILALFTGGHQEFETCVDQVANLRDDGFKIISVLTRTAAHIIGEDKVRQITGSDEIYQEGTFFNVNSLITRVDIVIIPILTRNTAMKLSNVISDSAITSLIFQGCMLNKPVIAVRNSADPKLSNCACVGLSTGPPVLLEEIDKRLDALESFGITLVEAKELRSAVLATITQQSAKIPAAKQDRKVILTARDVEDALLNNQKEIEIPSGSQVTDIAKEVAAKSGVIIRIV